MLPDGSRLCLLNKFDCVCVRRGKGDDAIPCRAADKDGYLTVPVPSWRLLRRVGMQGSFYPPRANEKQIRFWNTKAEKEVFEDMRWHVLYSPAKARLAHAGYVRVIFDLTRCAGSDRVVIHDHLVDVVLR